MKIKTFLKKELTGWTKSEICLLSLILILVICVSLHSQDSIIATLSAVFGLTYTIIAGKGKISCYFFGILGTSLYAYLSFKNALYGNFILYLFYYFPMEIVGILAWKKHLKKDTNEIKKTFLKNKERIFLFALTLIFSSILGFILKYFNDKFPFIDAFVTVASILGMYLTVKRCIEQWIVWTIVNFLCALMWIILIINGAKAIATLLMWIIYFILGIYFYIQWKKEIKNENA